MSCRHSFAVRISFLLDLGIIATSEFSPPDGSCLVFSGVFCSGAFVLGVLSSDVFFSPIDSFLSFSFAFSFLPIFSSLSLLFFLVFLAFFVFLAFDYSGSSDVPSPFPTSPFEGMSLAAPYRLETSNLVLLEGEASSSELSRGHLPGQGRGVWRLS